MEEDPETDEDLNANLPQNRKKRVPKWKKRHGFDKKFLFDENSCCLGNLICNLGASSPFEVWKCLFTNKIIDHIIYQTNLCGNRDKNKPNYQVADEEIHIIL